MRWLGLVLLVTLVAAEDPSGLAQARLARGDAAGARAVLDGVACPAQGAGRAAWLDAQARVAWHEGRNDEAFARGALAIACAEASGLTLPTFLSAFGGGRAWLDAETGLAPRLLPTGDASDARALAAELRAAPEARGPEGAWISLAACLLDPSLPVPKAVDRPVPDSAKVAKRREAFMRAALAARAGDAEAASAALRTLARDCEGIRAACHWFEAEALRRRDRADLRLASLRFVQCAAELDDAPWLRAAALRRAADTIETTDPAEAARLRAAADQEIP